MTNLNSADAVLSSYSYTLAPNGRRTGVAEQTLNDDNITFTVRNISYIYDALNRLTKEISACADNAELDYSSEYLYDLVGNRLRKTIDDEIIDYVYNVADQLTTESSSVKGSTAYQYDANGSLTSKINASQQQSYAYTYSLQNRLASATITRMEGSTLVDITSAYVYNQSGIRVSANSTTNVNGATGQTSNRTFLLDSGFTGYAQVLEEKLNGILAKSYTLGDDVLAQTVSGVTSYLQYDGHGSTRLLTDASGSVTDRYDYDSYGVNLFSANATSPATTDLLYSGEQFDPNLQQQYLRARYYDQNNGTFNRLDPYVGNHSDPQSLHKYAYCHGNPVNSWDPTGRFSLVEMVVNTAIQSILFSIVGEAVSPIVNAFAGSLIPATVKAKLLATMDESAYMAGFEIGISRYFGNISGGGELLYSTQTNKFAIYGYAGGGLSLQKTGAGAEGYMGVVYNADTSEAYRKHFAKLKLPAFKVIPKLLQNKIRMGLRNYLFKFLRVPYVTALDTAVGIDNARWSSLTSKMQNIQNKLNRVGVSLFWDPTSSDGAFGWSVGLSTSEATLGLGYSYYEQIYPVNNDVPFR